MLRTHDASFLLFLPLAKYYFYSMHFARMQVKCLNPEELGEVFVSNKKIIKLMVMD
jgi:hypothetical protein